MRKKLESSFSGCFAPAGAIREAADAPGRRRALLPLALLTALALASCGGHLTEADTQAAKVASASSSAQLFTVPPEQMNHVVVAPVQLAAIRRVLRVSGTVAYNSFATTPVITQVSGPVTRILVVPGQQVRAGQPLMYVSSPDFSQARTTYLKSRDALWLAEKSYARARDLYDHHAIAEADFQQADSSRNQAQADFQAAEQALRVLGIQHPDSVVKNSSIPEIPVLAPIAGEVVERPVAPGQVVQGGASQVLTISDMSTVWVLANIYERDLDDVRLGDEVTIQTDAYPTAFHGRISYIAPALDPNSRTAQVRIVTRNPHSELKKDMYVTAEVNAGKTRPGLVVPDAAVLRDSENQPFVYVLAAPGQFARRLVSVGDSEGGKTQILNGLSAGEKVMAEGSLFLQFANSYQR